MIEMESREKTFREKRQVRRNLRSKVLADCRCRSIEYRARIAFEYGIHLASEKLIGDFEWMIRRANTNWCLQEVNLARRSSR